METSYNNIKNDDMVMPLLDFARKYGKMFVGNFTNKTTGVHFTACQFGEGPNYVMVYFSEETGIMSPREIVDAKDKLVVKLADNGKYYLTYRNAPIVEKEISKTIVENENQSIFINTFAGQGCEKKKCGSIAFWLSQNAPENIYRQLYGFYQDYPDAKVVHPNFYGLTDKDIFNAIDEFCCVIKKKRAKLITTYLHPLDNYCADKYGDEIYKSPTFWFVVVLFTVWYILVLCLCRPFEWWFPLVGIIGGIPSIGVVGLVLSVVLQFLCTFVYNCYVANKITKDVREFSKSYVYMILQAQANYIQHYQADRNS